MQQNQEDSSNSPAERGELPDPIVTIPENQGVEDRHDNVAYITRDGNPVTKTHIRRTIAMLTAIAEGRAIVMPAGDES